MIRAHRGGEPCNSGQSHVLEERRRRVLFMGTMKCDDRAAVHACDALQRHCQPTSSRDTHSEDVEGSVGKRTPYSSALNKVDPPSRVSRTIRDAERHPSLQTIERATSVTADPPHCLRADILHRVIWLECMSMQGLSSAVDQGIPYLDLLDFPNRRDRALDVILLPAQRNGCVGIPMPAFAHHPSLPRRHRQTPSDTRWTIVDRTWSHVTRTPP
jgi:hypothetical protein